MNIQPQLIDNQGGGPVFEFGPGWGFKAKRWFKKYILGGDCTLCRNVRYILLIGAVALIFFGRQIQSLVKNGAYEQPVSTQTITEDMRHGDSRVKLARRAVTDYLARFPDNNLSNGQRIFIEEQLRQKIAGQTLVVGDKIEFALDNIKIAIMQSKYLSPTALKKWESYAAGVKF